MKFIKRVLRYLLIPFLKNKKLMMRNNEQSKESLRVLLERAGIENGVIVEIGSYRGESAEVFLGTGRVSRIYCVDPWKEFYDADDGAAFTDMKKVEADFNRRHSNDSRVVKCKGTIDDFVAAYAGVDADLVYIDGLHTYEGVKHDIEVTKSKIGPKIAIAGHDYNSYWPGYLAIREAFGDPDFVFPDTSWIKFVK